MIIKCVCLQPFWRTDRHVCLDRTRQTAPNYFTANLCSLIAIGNSLRQRHRSVRLPRSVEFDWNDYIHSYSLPFNTLEFRLRFLFYLQIGKTCNVSEYCWYLTMQVDWSEVKKWISGNLLLLLTFGGVLIGRSKLHLNWTTGSSSLSLC